MFDLFRFIALRPPEASIAGSAIPLFTTSELGETLKAASQEASPRARMRQLADDFMASDAFAGSSVPMRLAGFLDKMQQNLDRLALDAAVPLAKLDEVINASFNATADRVLQLENFKQDKERLHNTLLALKLGTERTDVAVSALMRNVRLLALIEQIAARDAMLTQSGAVTRALARPLLFPEALLNFPRAETAGGGTGSSGSETTAQQREALLQKFATLQSVYRLLSQVEPDDIAYHLFTITPQVDGRHEAASEVTRTLRTTAARMARMEVERLGDQSNELEPKLTRWNKLREFATTEDLATFDGEASPLAQNASLNLAKIILKPAAVERFSAEEKAALGELNVQLETTALPVAVERVRNELAALTPTVMGELQRRATAAFDRRLIAVGNQFFLSGALPDMPEMQTLAGGPVPVPALPDTHSSLKPAGVGDLLVTRQQLIGYEVGEVAHIENVMLSESHKRAVERSETFEESTITEQESTKSEERDQQSTDRYELQKESQAVLTLDGRVTPGSSSSAKFGPVVEFENGDQTQLHGVQTQSERSAERFSRDVTSRAASRVTERTRMQIMRRSVRQFNEKTEHAFNNTEGQKHIIGIYQWVNKIYQTQVFNYGKRLFYDLVIPEPAAFLVQALAKDVAEGRSLYEPEAFTIPLPNGTQRPLQADDITDTNYAYYAARYQATGIKAPPDAYQMVSKIFVAGTSPTPQQIELMVPDGYEPATNSDRIFLKSGTAGLGISNKLKKPLDLTISKGDSWSAQLGCRRKASLYQQWQLNTYEALLRAYHERLADYEERLASMQAALRIGALGQSSEQKRRLERNEIKKAGLTLFTQQHFDVFNGIDSPKDKPVPYPQINLANAEVQGRYIRFFEHAFEWEQMTYSFYPYFWGRKTHWVTKALSDERDPEFAEFLSAGAARSLVPVRPGFEHAVLHFMETGEIRGGDPLEVVSQAYLPLLEELKTAADFPAQGRPYGEPWKVMLPTTLIKLRADDKLPKWKEVNGEWVEDV